MSFFVYIIYSELYDRYYIGQTHNVDERLIRHNHGYENATAPFAPWLLKCFIEKESRSEAVILEKKLKNLKRERLTAFILKYG